MDYRRFLDFKPEANIQKNKGYTIPQLKFVFLKNF